jgi:hypothetical protein
MKADYCLLNAELNLYTAHAGGTRNFPRRTELVLAAPAVIKPAGVQREATPPNDNISAVSDDKAVPSAVTLSSD